MAESSRRTSNSPTLDADYSNDFEAIEGSRKRRCKWCAHEVASNVSRFAEHILGDVYRTYRKNCARSDVAACSSEHAADIRKTALKEIAEDSDADDEQLDELVPERPGPGRPRGSRSASSSQRKLEDVWEERARANLDELFAAMVIEEGLALRHGEKPAVKAFLKAVVEYKGAGWTPPTAYRVGGPLLDSVVKKTERMMEQLQAEWTRTGMTLQCDGWTDRLVRSVILCMAGTVQSGYVFMRGECDQVSRKTGEYIASFLRASIEEVGPERIVQIVMDNAGNNWAAVRILRPDYPHIIFSRCTAHCLDLCIEDIMGRMPECAVVLAAVNRICVFVKRHGTVAGIFRELFSKLELLRPGKTRFGTNYIMLERFISVETNLRAMVASTEWAAVPVTTETEGCWVQQHVLDATFWARCKAVLNLVAPVYDMLRRVDTTKELVPWLYDDLLTVTKKLREAAVEVAPVLCVARRKKQQQATAADGSQAPAGTAIVLGRPVPFRSNALFVRAVCDSLQRRWDGSRPDGSDGMHSPLHSVGMLLNPAFIGENLDEPQLMRDWHELFRQLEPSEAKRQELHAQLVDEFLVQRGSFGSAPAKLAVERLVKTREMEVAQWWSLYGESAKELRKWALRLLPQGVSASDCERGWSVFGRLQRKDRVRLDPERMAKLARTMVNRKTAQRYDKLVDARRATRKSAAKLLEDREESGRRTRARTGTQDGASLDDADAAAATGENTASTVTSETAASSQEALAADKEDDAEEQEVAEGVVVDWEVFGRLSPDTASDPMVQGFELED